MYVHMQYRKKMLFCQLLCHNCKHPQSASPGEERERWRGEGGGGGVIEANLVAT